MEYYLSMFIRAVFIENMALAFFLVAVMFDRITQSEDQDGLNLFKKIGLAWRHRADGEAFMEATTGAEAAPPTLGRPPPARRLPGPPAHGAGARP